MNYRDYIIEQVFKIAHRRNTELILAQLNEHTPLYQQGIGMDSLDIAELAVLLEKTYGREPFSQGLRVHTIGELIDFYQSNS